MSTQHVNGLTWTNRSGATVYEFPPRLIVRAATQVGVKTAYIWQIVRDNGSDRVLRESSDPFRTMEEAYSQGAIILRDTCTKH
jgi:hypothetical protein